MVVIWHIWLRVQLYITWSINSYRYCPNTGSYSYIWLRYMAVETLRLREPRSSIFSLGTVYRSILVPVLVQCRSWTIRVGRVCPRMPSLATVLYSTVVFEYSSSSSWFSVIELRVCMMSLKNPVMISWNLYDDVVKNRRTLFSGQRKHRCMWHRENMHVFLFSHTTTCS